jgi:beta-lactamase regulating signal transducer with metallopeptidase domain
LFLPLARVLGFLGEVAMGVWIAGAAVGLLLLLYSAGRLAWVAVRSEPVVDARWEALAEEVRRKLGIRRPVRLLQNRTVPFLGTWGIVVPRVLLPSDAENWSDERIRMVLGHELAHIRRHDWVVQVLADAARAIYWFNPVFWLASSRLRRESEHACDDTVVRMGAAGTHYAEELVEMTRALRSERLQSPILAMAQPSHLEQRLVALLNPSHNRLAATPWAVLVVTLVAVALTLPLAAVRSPESEAPAVSVSMPTPIAPLFRAPAAEPPPVPTPPARAVRPPVPAPSPPSAGASGAARGLPAAASFDCPVTSSQLRTKTASIAKEALGNGPWLINDDRTIWAADQPYVANRVVNTVWMRPANTELTVNGRRLDGDAPELRSGPAAPYETGYIAIGLTFPAPGCWEVTATAGDSKLTFVTQVRE